MTNNIEVLRGLVEAVARLDADPLSCEPAKDSLAGQVVAQARALAARGGQGEAGGVALKPSTVLDALRHVWKRWGYTEDEMKARAFDSSTDISLLWDAGKLYLPPAPQRPEAGEPAAIAEYVLALLIAGGFVTQAKADEARKIALGVAPGPLQPEARVGGEVVCAVCEEVVEKIEAGYVPRGHGVYSKPLQQPAPVVPEGLTPRHWRLIDFALWRLINSSYHNANAAAQDKEGAHWKQGSMEAFLRDAKDAEAARLIVMKAIEVNGWSAAAQQSGDADNG